MSVSSGSIVNKNNFQQTVIVNGPLSSTEAKFIEALLTLVSARFNELNKPCSIQGEAFYFLEDKMFS